MISKYKQNMPIKIKCGSLELNRTFSHSFVLCDCLFFTFDTFKAFCNGVVYVFLRLQILGTKIISTFDFYFIFPLKMEGREVPTAAVGPYAGNKLNSHVLKC